MILFFKLLLLPSAFNFKSFSRSLEQFDLTVGQNNFENKIPFKLHTGPKTIHVSSERILPHFVFFTDNSIEACFIQ